VSFAQSFGFDWQFFVVTAVALWGLWTILRQFLPAGLLGGGEQEDTDPCGHCAAGAACISRLHRDGEEEGAPRLVRIGGIGDRRT
jgi:hypothetical protein